MKKEEVSQFYDQFSERQIKIGVNERLIFLFKKLKKLGFTKNSKILELGCGVGAFTYWYMAAFFRQVKIGVLTLTLEKKQ